MTKEQKTDPTKVKQDDIMSFTHFTKVEQTKNFGKKLKVHNLDNGDEFVIEGKDLVANGKSADQFEKVEKVSSSELAKILITSFNIPFTVSFKKKDGTRRLLRGRFVHHEDLMGRSMVEDLDIHWGSHRLRQVDHRTIEYLIVDNVKYVAK